MSKIVKDTKLPEDIKTPQDIPNLDGIVKSKPAKILKKEELVKSLRGPKDPDFKTPIFEVSPKILGMKDILDKDGRRHIQVRDINKGKIIKVKDL